MNRKWERKKQLKKFSSNKLRKKLESRLKSKERSMRLWKDISKVKPQHLGALTRLLDPRDIPLLSQLMWDLLTLTVEEDITLTGMKTRSKDLPKRWTSTTTMLLNTRKVVRDITEMKTMITIVTMSMRKDAIREDIPDRIEEVKTITEAILPKDPTNGTTIMTCKTSMLRLIWLEMSWFQSLTHLSPLSKNWSTAYPTPISTWSRQWPPSWSWRGSISLTPLSRTSSESPPKKRSQRRLSLVSSLKNCLCERRPGCWISSNIRLITRMNII